MGRHRPPPPPPPQCRSQWQDGWGRGAALGARFLQRGRGRGELRGLRLHLPALPLGCAECPPRQEAVGLVQVGGAKGPGGVGGLSLQGGWGLSPRGFAFFFFFFSAPFFFFFFKSILFRGGARAAAEKRDTPARSQGFRTEGKEPRRVARLPVLRRHFSRANPNSPVTSVCPQAAHPPGAPDNFRGGVRRKFAAPAARLHAARPRRLSARARPFGLARDRVLPRHRHHEQALHRQPQRERDPRRLGESIRGAQDLLQRPVLGQIRLRLRGLPRRALGDEGHRNFLG